MTPNPTSLCWAGRASGSPWSHGHGPQCPPAAGTKGTELSLMLLWVPRTDPAKGTCGTGQDTQGDPRALGTVTLLPPALIHPDPSPSVSQTTLERLSQRSFGASRGHLPGTGTEGGCCHAGCHQSSAPGGGQAGLGGGVPPGCCPTWVHPRPPSPAAGWAPRGEADGGGCGRCLSPSLSLSPALPQSSHHGAKSRRVRCRRQALVPTCATLPCALPAWAAEAAAQGLG